MKFIKPEQKYLKSYYEACCETWGHVHDNYIIHNPNEYADWKNHIFQDYKDYENGENLPEGIVPSVTYWLINNEEYIATINIRPELNENLKKYGGHIGIAIRLSKRNKIYGVAIAKFAAQKIKEMNIKPLLLTCEETNRASWRIIEFFKPSRCEKDTIIYNGAKTDIRRYYFD